MAMHRMSFIGLAQDAPTKRQCGSLSLRMFAKMCFSALCWRCPRQSARTFHCNMVQETVAKCRVGSPRQGAWEVIERWVRAWSGSTQFRIESDLIARQSE